MNYRMIRYTLGVILMFEAGFLLLPLITSIVYGELHELISILLVATLCLTLGYLMSAKKPDNMTLYAREGFVIVSLSWIILSLFGALPFVLSGTIPNFIDALFETVSGFTTTGSTILTSIEIMPKSLLLWRSFTHWVGGMGVLVFVMAILPLSGGENIHIMRAESPGPEVSKLVPRVKKTAIILYAIYLVMTLIMIFILLPAMSVFDAINTAFATAGTGGFGVKNDSIASYGAYVQIVCTVFMLLFSINFNSYYLLLRGKFKDSFNSEVRTFIFIVLCAITIITVDLFSTGAEGASTLPDALLHSSFSVASVISTTGFMTLDFNLWSNVSKTVLVLLMFVGACAGSTGGGIKVSRIIILFKGMAREVAAVLRPKQVKKITMDKRPVDNEVIRSVNSYLVIYVLLFVMSLFILSFDSYAVKEGMSPMVTNFTAVTTTINNIGPGLDMAGPAENFSFFSPLSKIVLIFDMLAGRLELLPMLLLFSPTTWKKNG